MHNAQRRVSIMSELPKLSVCVQDEVDVSEVIAIAEAAGQVILEIYNDDTDWEVTAKSDNSPLTKADKEANAFICSRLQRMAPHIPIVSEENESVTYEIRKGYQYFWCVDPLDGTKEFIKRNGQFTVNIALIQGVKPVMGVVHTPVSGQTHYAVHDQGAFRKSDGGTEPISAAEFSEKDSGLTIIGSRSHRSPLTEAFMSQFDQPQFTLLGSSLKLLMIAEGTAHVYPRLAPTSEWDTAAAHVIVIEAGGEVLQAGKCDHQGQPLEDWQTALAEQKPVVYNKESFLNPYFIVYGKRRKM